MFSKAFVSREFLVRLYMAFEQHSLLTGCRDAHGIFFLIYDTFVWSLSDDRVIGNGGACSNHVLMEQRQMDCGQSFNSNSIFPTSNDWRFVIVCDELKEP